MSGAADDGLCHAVKWCDELDNPNGPHRRTLYDQFGVDLVSGRPQVIQVLVQGVTTTDRNAVLITGLCQTAIAWPTARDLGLLLRDQARANGAS